MAERGVNVAHTALNKTALKIALSLIKVMLS